MIKLSLIVIILSGTIYGVSFSPVQDSPPSDTANLYSVIESKIRESTTSAVAITNIPKEMYLNETYSVVVRFSLSPNVTSEMSSANQEYRKINITGLEMRVELFGDNFKIEPLSPSTQIMPKDDGYVQWVWAVTPQLIGNQSLDLTIYSYVFVEGRQRSLLNGMVRQVVHVKAKPTSNIMSSMGFFHTFIVIFIVPFWLKYSRFRRGEIRRKY